MNTANEIGIVSGLPRSGTSLAMQMLAAGGIEAYTDGVRVADESNPCGYLELEAVKKLKQDSSWIPQARGKAVKVISHLAAALPVGESYRVIFLERDLEEVLDSQEAMLGRLGQPAAPRDAVRRAFQAHLADFDRLVVPRSDMRVLRLAYPQIISDPEQAAELIAAHFAEGWAAPLEVQAMTSAVDPTLYRNRR